MSSRHRSRSGRVRLHALATGAFALVGCGAISGLDGDFTLAAGDGGDAATGPESESGASESGTPEAGADGTSSSSGDARAPGDAGDATDGPSLNAERIVFTTRADYTGALGGLNGADETCNMVARSSMNVRVRGGRYRAWLSTAAAPIAGRLAKDARPFRRPDNVLVATSWEALASNTHQAALNADQDGVLFSSATSMRVWTGSSAEGAFVSTGNPPCNDWNGGADAIAGDPRVTDERWSNAGGWGCGGKAHLLCIEE